jgi:hypothetical protein
MAEVIDLREFSDDSFVIHFGGERHGIDAATFAQALLGFTEAMRSINRELNPGYELDVVIEAVGPGSFRARLRAVKRAAGNLFSTQTVSGTIILGLLVNFIYDKVFPSEPTIIVNTDAVIVDYNGKQVVVTKEAMEAKKRIEKNTELNRHVAETIEVLERDPEVTSFGITKELDDPKPAFEIPRALFPTVVAATRPPDDVKNQTVDVEATLTVIKAILQRSSRKWEFYWNGHAISAPIRDDTFFDRLVARQISLQHGDTFSALLRIHQVRDEMTGAWVNRAYEVLKVYEVIARRDEQWGIF